MKGVKRFLVFFLSCALALSTMGLAPMTARAEEGDLKCDGFLGAYTDGYEITADPQTYMFHSQTHENHTGNFETPLFVVFHSENGGTASEAKEGGNQYAVIRSDNFCVDDRAGKVGPTIKASEDFPAGFDADWDASWAAWQAANRDGVDCSVTTQLYNNYALVGVSNNGITTTYVVPINPDAKNYVALSGENCTLSNVKAAYGDYIDLSAAKGKVDSITTEPEDPGDDVSREVFLECGDQFWSAHTEGFEITEEAHTYVFHSKTKAGATGNWLTPIYVVFHSEDKKVNGPEYKEYGVIRSDNWYWDANGENDESNITQATTVLPNWGTWLAENIKGVDCTVTTQLYNGNALIGISNNGATATYVVPVDSSIINYLSLSGQSCTLSDLQTSDQHIDLSAAKASVDAATDEPGTDEPGTDTPGTDEPGTDEPGTDTPGTDEPGTDVPGTDTPGTDEPGTDVPGDDGSQNVFLECGDFWSAHTGGFEITEEAHTYVFHSKTKAGAVDNWLTPIYVVFHSEDSKVNGTGYKEYGVIRSDNWYWDEKGATVGSNITQATSVTPDWGAWLAENISGVDCTVTTQLYNGNALIGVSNSGATATYVVPVDSAVKNYLSLTGQSCTLSNLRTSDQHIDLSAAKESVDASGNDPGTDIPGGVFLDCPGWWQAHTAGMEITEEPQTYKFHSKTYEGATANWNTPVFVVFNSEDALVKEAGAAGYTEYGVIRSDHFHWGDYISETSVVYPAGFDADWDASWAAWQAANRAGVDCSVTTQLYNGYALVGVSNSGITTTYAIKVNPAVKNYLSLTGELCTLSDLQTSDQHIDLSAAKAGADAGITPSNNSNNSNNSGAPAAPASSVQAIAGGEVLSGSAWWSGMAIGSNQPISGDGTWSWVIQAASLMDGYGAFSVEVYDPATNGYITTGSDMNAWTAEGFDPAKALVSGVAAELASNLVEGHTYVVTVTRSGNSFVVQYVDFTDNKEICTLTIIPGEVVSNDIVVHVMAQVGTYVTSFCEGALIDAPTKAKAAKGGEVLKGTEWWAGMMKGTDRIMSGDGTWTWTVQASSLMDGYGAFSVEIYDPSTNGYITTGSDKNAWTAEGFNPDSALITGVPKTLDSKLVEGHTYAVTVTRSGNTFTVRYTDHTTGKEICTLVITPAEIVGQNVQIHVMAQVGTFVTAFNEGTLIAALGDSIPVAFYVIAVIGLAAIIFGLKKRFAK